MTTKFALPTTPKSKVIYTREGTLYSAVIETPRSNDSLQLMMLSRKISMKNVQRVEPIQPMVDFHRPHPAMRDLARYATTAEH